MAFASLPPELRSLCRRLTATKVEQLPSLLPSLLKDLLRCQEPLSRPQEAKTSESSSESTVLVHKLKTQISALLNSRNVQGRFVGVALVKCVIETGGWECLRTSELWVRGILSILQRKDPAVVKDLCIVTLVKIYTLMHAYPTLVREIVTPTLPTFATACLQVLKPPASSKAAKIPNSLVEHIFEAFSTIIPLYPTTLRQFASKFRVETRPYIAPTISDGTITPASLQASSRRLAIRLHMTAVKGGDSSEWAKHLDGLIKTFHSTADQVFRAVQESWEPTSGHVLGSVLQQAAFDNEPQGGSTNLEQLPLWVGIYAGSERMIALLDFVGEYLRCRTKTAVTIPVSSIVDIITRISSILPPSQGGEKSTSIQMNPAVGREEKDELWTVFSDIQLAAINLLHTVARRLGRNFMPVAQESLEQLIRMFESSYRLPEIRKATFLFTKDILQLCGPTMAKLAVESISLVAKACCRDLLGSAGHLKRPRQPASAAQVGQKQKSISQNADAFLSTKAEDESISTTLSADHISAAAELLTTLFSHVPQQHLPSSLRAQMLRTAILCQNRDAQVASVLHPARDKSGRTPQVILPYLVQQFPRDESVEILRFNFRPMATGSRNDFMDVDDTSAADDPEEQPPSNGPSFNQPFASRFTGFHEFPGSNASEAPRSHSPPRAIETAVKAPNPFVPKPSSELATVSEEEHAATSTVQPSPPILPLKRKNESEDIAASKRIEISKATAISAPVPTAHSHAAPAASSAAAAAPNADDEDSDDESVHLNMDLDSDEDLDDDDGEEI
ncbi:uncharacterized protein F4807DRAFT_305639 [Annulohypoxylon truncatum]|uniref:uncharacterized protein n=1 Tax=Annulohypoxylon truncatum TaxID=327061 RepID=UPI0020087B61|nr:uncharacterized protein F4807DRAFT_305639 [Annulohypoxylon truncatum]KAI1212952.1 hypothetical protein F4807DRAFT_305639 [Annulohypoxylon truncatum]